MSSPSTKPFKKPSKLPFCVHLYMPKPLYHPTSNKCIIITTDCLEYYETSSSTAAIYKYNIDTNESQILYKYNIDTNESQIIYKYTNTFTSNYHGQFIDPSNNTLILYGGTFGIFDLNTNQMKQIND
eukprot:536150_1